MSANGVVGSRVPRDRMETTEGRACRPATAVPPLRFKGFDGEWDGRQLGDMGTPYNGLSGKCKSDFGHGTGRYVTYLDVFRNPVAAPADCEAIDVDRSQNEVRDGDVFFTTSSETPEEVGMSSVWSGDGSGTYLNSFCFGYRPREKIEIDYWAYMLRAQSFRKRIVILAQGISRYNISKGKVMELTVDLPTIPEQQKIGTSFRQIDALIAAREKALGKLTNLKKAMLEKMFPRAGAKVPEVRFKGFEGEWEEVPFKAFATIRRGLTYSPNDCAKIGVRVLRSSNIAEDTFSLHDDDVFVSVEAVNIQYVRSGDILVTAANGSSSLVGKHALIPESIDRCVHGGFMHLISTKEPDFLNSLMSASWYRRFVAMHMMGGNGALGNLPSSAFDELGLLIPCSIDERQKIGTFFRSLDALIAARREEVGKLKDLKKALLDRMFV